MATGITNDAGEEVATFGSDAEAVRWWLEMGRPGDTLTDTGELVSAVAEQLDLDETERHDAD